MVERDWHRMKMWEQECVSEHDVGQIINAPVLQMLDESVEVAKMVLRILEIAHGFHGKLIY